MGFDIEKIGGIQKIYKIYSVDKKREVKGTAPVQGRKDELTISKEAVDYGVVAKGIKIMGSIPDIRKEKVNAIKEKMDSGLYNVDGKDVAQKMLADKFDKKV